MYDVHEAGSWYRRNFIAFITTEVISIGKKPQLTLARILRVIFILALQRAEN